MKYLVIFLLCRTKGCAQKKTVSCPVLVKKYNSGMGGVDLCDQKKSTYALDRRAKFRYYLRMFFDLLDMSCVNAYVIYRGMSLETSDQLSFRDFKLLIAEKLTAHKTFRKRSTPTSRPSKAAKVARVGSIVHSAHLPIYDDKRARCVLCSARKVENRTYVKCATCDVRLCFQPGRNCFMDYH